MIHHRLIDNQVEMSTLALKLLIKSLINVVIINRKTWSSYHCILDHVISLLILTYLNLIGSDTAIASRPATSRPKNCEWIGFSIYLLVTYFSLFLNRFISYFWI